MEGSGIIIQIQEKSYKKSECNPQKYYSAYQNLKDWRKIDMQLMSIYEQHKDKPYFQEVAQHISSRILRERLLKLNSTPEVKERVAFYLNLLVQNNSIEWEIITQSILFLNDGKQFGFAKNRHYEVLHISKNYLSRELPEHIPMLENVLLGLEEKIVAYEKENATKVDRKTTPLLNLKRVELEEARLALQLAQKI